MNDTNSKRSKSKNLTIGYSNLFNLYMYMYNIYTGYLNNMLCNFFYKVHVYNCLISSLSKLTTVNRQIPFTTSESGF